VPNRLFGLKYTKHFLKNTGVRTKYSIIISFSDKKAGKNKSKNAIIKCPVQLGTGIELNL